MISYILINAKFLSGWRVGFEFFASTVRNRFWIGAKILIIDFEKNNDNITLGSFS